VTTTSIASTTTTVHVAVSDAPPLKVSFVYHDVTELVLTYTGNRLTELRVLGVEEDTGVAEWLETDLNAYEAVQPWIRGEVEKHRPSTRARARQQSVLDRAAEAIDGEAWPHEKPERENQELYRLADKVRALPISDIDG